MSAKGEGSPSLTLIYLAYNEGKNLRSVLEEGITFCQENLSDWQIVVVDDGSTDGSNLVVESVAGEEPRVSLCRHPTNRGMGAGMSSGVKAAQKDYFVFLAADGQTPAQNLLPLIPHLKTADIVSTTYPRNARDFVRTALSRGLRAYMRLRLGIRFQLEGLYLFPTKAGKSMVGKIESETFFFSFELIDRGLREGMTVVTTEMPYEERKEGQSKVANVRRILRVAKEVNKYAARRRTTF